MLRGRTLGRNPVAFWETLQTTIDLSEHYSADQKVISASAATTGAIAGLDDVLTFTAPTRVHAVGGRLQAGAAAITNLTLMCGLRNATTGERIAIETLFIASVAAGGVVHFGGVLRAPVFPVAAPVGGNWSCFALATGTAAGVDHTLSARALIDVITGVI